MARKHIRKKKKQTFLTAIFKNVLHAVLNIKVWAAVYSIAIIASVVLFIFHVFSSVVFGKIMGTVIATSGAVVAKFVEFSRKKR